MSQTHPAQSMFLLFHNQSSYTNVSLLHKRKQNKPCIASRCPNSIIRMEIALSMQILLKRGLYTKTRYLPKNDTSKAQSLQLSCTGLTVLKRRETQEPTTLRTERRGIHGWYRTSRSTRNIHGISLLLKWAPPKSRTLGVSIARVSRVRTVRTQTIADREIEPYAEFEWM